MHKRHLVEYTFDRDDVLAALWAMHPEIQGDAQVLIGFRSGNGPGSYKNRNGVRVYPFVRVTTEVPNPKETP